MSTNTIPSSRLPQLLGWLAALAAIGGLCAIFTWPEHRQPQRASAATSLSFEQVVEQMQQNQATHHPAPSTQPAILNHPQASGQIARLSQVLREHLARYNEFPTGNNAEITRALMGKNPEAIKFIVPEELPVNAAGQLVDFWQTPYFFHQLAGQKIEVRSAGPDREMWTADDLTLFPK